MRTVLIALLVFIAAAGAYAYFGSTVEAPGQARDTRIMPIEDYVRQNISQLSPVDAVMGGTFYVTNIEAADGRGTVWYEDGHIALVADFQYVQDAYGISVASFDVRE